MKCNMRFILIENRKCSNIWSRPLRPNQGHWSRSYSASGSGGRCSGSAQPGRCASGSITRAVSIKNSVFFSPHVLWIFLVQFPNRKKFTGITGYNFLNAFTLLSAFLEALIIEFQIYLCCSQTKSQFPSQLQTCPYRPTSPATPPIPRCGSASPSAGRATRTRWVGSRRSTPTHTRRSYASVFGGSSQVLFW